MNFEFTTLSKTTGEQVPVRDAPDRSRYKRRAILILGMHRSGTSALTKTLGLCGAALPRGRMFAAPGNGEAEHWESPEICALHEEIFYSLGSFTYDTLNIPSAWFGTVGVAYFKKRIIAVLRGEFGDEPLIVVKDPRACRLVPMWLSVFEEIGVEPLVVIPVRNPIEVAASLSVRDGVELGNSLMLWMRSFLTAERDTRGVKRTFIAYTDLLQDWEVIVERIGADLGIAWPKKDATAAREIESFLRTELRHHICATANFRENPNIITVVKDAYEWALRATEGNPPDTAILDRIDKTLTLTSQFHNSRFRAFTAQANEHGRYSKMVIEISWSIRYAIHRALWPAKLAVIYLSRNGPEMTVARIVEILRDRS